jgi:hypothetical protein
MSVNEHPGPGGGPGPRRAPSGAVLVLPGRIAPADIPALCERAGELFAGCHDDPIVCDTAAIARPDAATVDALARLQLTARRLGRRVRFRDACGDLRDLVELVGLGRVLPCGPDLPRDP